QAIDRVGHKVILDQEILAYSRLVLALGADPIRLPVSPAAEGRVFSVNDLGDYRRFVQAITGRQRIAILGAGLIGCEFADDLSRAGYRLDLIELAPRALARLLPPENARYFETASQGSDVHRHL